MSARRWRSAIVAPLAGLLPALSFALPAVERTLSTSRQFIIFGPDTALRGAIADLAEQTKRQLLETLRERDAWKTPILVDAEPQQANLPDAPAAALNLSQTGFGPKIQLDLTIAAAPDPLAIRRELLRAVLVELIYRASPEIAAGTPVVQPPDWLLDGLLAVASSGDDGRLVRTLRGLVQQQKITPVAEFVQQQPSLLDASAREIYRAYAFGLMTTLLDRDGGRAAVRRFISDLAKSPNDTIADFEAHFPGLANSGVDGEKLWTAALARIAAADSPGLWTAAETEQRLNEALGVEIRENGRLRVYQLVEYQQFARNPSAPAALRRVAQDLLVVGSRANPIYRPLVAEYQAIATGIAQKKTEAVPARLRRLASLRETISTRMEKIQDYINWFEATQSRSDSGAFASYMKAAESAAERQPRRHDRISVYLDNIENQFGSER